MTGLTRTGRVWRFGDNINTDLIQPSTVFRLPQNQQHRQCFEAIRPGWVDQVSVGDLIVAGDNFGLGSGRPLGAILHACGIRGVVANSVNGLALRNCINASLPAIGCAGVVAAFEDGDQACIDFLTGHIENLRSGQVLETTPLAKELAAIIAAGGLVQMLVEQGYIERAHFVAASS